MSKEVDRENNHLNQKVFSAVDKLWGPHTIDCFASRLSRQTSRYISRSANPDCVAVGAFSLSWAGENCWLFPPPRLIAKTLQHLQEAKGHGSLLVPVWPSQSWWPLLLEENRSVFASYIADMREIEWFPELFTACGMLQSVFTDGKFTSRVLVLRLCFAECCRQNGQTDSMAEDLPKLLLQIQ